MVPNQIISSWSHRRMTMHCSKLTHRIHPLFPLYALHALTNLQPGGPSTASAWITHPQQPSNALQPARSSLLMHYSLHECTAPTFIRSPSRCQQPEPTPSPHQLPPTQHPPAQQRTAPSASPAAAAPSPPAQLPLLLQAARQ